MTLTRNQDTLAAVLIELDTAAHPGGSGDASRHYLRK